MSAVFIQQFHFSVCQLFRHLTSATCYLCVSSFPALNWQLLSLQCLLDHCSYVWYSPRKHKMHFQSKYSASEQDHIKKAPEQGFFCKRKMCSEFSRCDDHFLSTCRKVDRAKEMGFAWRSGRGCLMWPDWASKRVVEAWLSYCGKTWRNKKSRQGLVCHLSAPRLRMKLHQVKLERNYQEHENICLKSGELVNHSY